MLIAKIKKEAHITRGSLFTVAALVPVPPRIFSDLTLNLTHWKTY